jgi:hypothetical protein
VGVIKTKRRRISVAAAWKLGRGKRNKLKYPSRQHHKQNIDRVWFGAENWSFSILHAGFDVAKKS